MKKITFTLAIDERSHTAEFKEDRCTLPIVKTWGDSNKDIAEVYRAAANHFLEMAFYLDNLNEFTTPDYNEDERDREFIKMCMERPFYFDS